MLSRNRPSKLVLQKKYLRRACFFYSFMSSWFYVLLSSTLSSKFYSLLFSQTMIYDWLPLYLIETYSHALLKQFTFSLLIPRLPPSPPVKYISPYILGLILFSGDVYWFKFIFPFIYSIIFSIYLYFALLLYRYRDQFRFRSISIGSHYLNKILTLKSCIIDNIKPLLYTLLNQIISICISTSRFG